MQNQYHDSNGFSLLETVIYIALFGMVMSGLVYFLVGMSQTGAKAIAISEVQAGERQVFAQLRQLIKGSGGINWSASRLVDEAGVLVLSDGGAIKINANNVLVLADNRGETAMTGNLIKVKKLTFTRLADTAVGIELTLDYWTNGAGNNLGYSGGWRSAMNVGL